MKQPLPALLSIITFRQKKRFFLALFQREYDLWTADIRQIFEKYEVMTVDEFASALAHTLEKRECLLKLLSMNHYDMESRSRLDNLVEFKNLMETLWQP